MRTPNVWRMALESPEEDPVRIGRVGIEMMLEERGGALECRALEAAEAEAALEQVLRTGLVLSLATDEERSRVGLGLLRLMLHGHSCGDGCGLDGSSGSVRSDG